MIRDPSDGTVRPTMPSLASLKDKYGENYGLNVNVPKRVSTFKAPTSDELAAHYARFGLAFKQREMT